MGFRVIINDHIFIFSLIVSLFLSYFLSYVCMCNHYIYMFFYSFSVLQPQHHNQYIELFLYLFPKALSISHDIIPHLDKAVELLWQYAISIPYGFNEKSANPCKMGASSNFFFLGLTKNALF